MSERSAERVRELLVEVGVRWLIVVVFVALILAAWDHNVGGLVTGLIGFVCLVVWWSSRGDR